MICPVVRGSARGVSQFNYSTLLIGLFNPQPYTRRYKARAADTSGRRGTDRDAAPTNRLYAFQIRFTRQRPRPEASIIMPLPTCWQQDGKGHSNRRNEFEAPFCPLLRRRRAPSLDASGSGEGEEKLRKYNKNTKPRGSRASQLTSETSHGDADKTPTVLELNCEMKPIPSQPSTYSSGVFRARFRSQLELYITRGQPEVLNCLVSIS